ncbi:hypothetical protein [Streptomyces sp. NPDC048309]
MTTTLHTRRSSRPSPDHHPSMTALGADSDKPHNHQDRRTT